MFTGYIKKHAHYYIFFFFKWKNIKNRIEIRNFNKVVRYIKKKDLNQDEK